MEVEQAVDEGFDVEAFEQLEADFGGFAGNWVKREYGAWDKDAAEEALLRLYRHRHELVGVTDSRERFIIVHNAFDSGGGHRAAKATRLERRLRELDECVSGVR